MIINVRFSGALASQIGAPRLSVTLPKGATIAHLIGSLQASYPDANALLDSAVFVTAGRQVPQTASLADGQEVALLLPIAGG